MINLNTIDVNELVLKLSNALFNAFDSNDYYDIKHQTGCTDEEVAQIIEARKIAKAISFEKKFIPLDLDVLCSKETVPGGWTINKGCEPADIQNVDVMWFDSDGTIDYNKPVKEWDWTIGTGNNSLDIQFWRYIK